MPQWLRTKYISVVALILLPVMCGLVFLAGHAPRDWSLHWHAPRILIAGTSSTDYAAATTQQGWNILWTDPGGQMFLSRFDHQGHRIGRDVAIHGSPTALTLGHAGNMDVAVWRQDVNGGSQLRSAIVIPSQPVSYHTLAAGTVPLEHPQAFSAGSDVDVVFSWQTKQFDVYLSRVHSTGSLSRPVQLTHAQTYAFNPFAVMDTQGNIRLLYMDECCGGTAFRMVDALYSSSGSPISKHERLDQIESVGSRGQGATPERWGLDVQRSGNEVWASWESDRGLSIAAWRNERLLIAPHVAVPGAASASLRLALAAPHRSIVWEQLTHSAQVLQTAPIGPDGTITAEPDRVAFEAASDEIPSIVSTRGQPALIYLSTPSKGTRSFLQASTFSPTEIGAPSIWAKLGLGLANPVGSFFVLLIAAVAVGLLMTVGNAVLLMVFIGLYLLAFRMVPQRFKWVAFAGGLTVGMYALFVSMGAPSPPVLFLSNLSPTLGLVAAGGMAAFVLILTFRFLRRIDDVYRAGAMAFAGFYFIAFLQALTIVQGSIGTV